MINKSKKHDVKFVEILAMEIIKPLLDQFENGEGWKNLLKSHPALTYWEELEESHGKNTRYEWSELLQTVWFQISFRKWFDYSFIKP